MLNRCILIVGIMGLFSINSCSRQYAEGNQMLFWCSNNNDEIRLCDTITDAWNRTHSAGMIHMQPVPEGQSSEEVILAAVVGKTTPDIYANMWQGSVEMYAKAHVLIPLDTIPGFLDFIYNRCDSAVIREITSADGHIYQVPWKVNPIMSIYNKSLFASNGIDSFPGTYSAYQQAAEIVKENNSKNGIEHSWFGYTEVKPVWHEMRMNFYPLYLAASGGSHLIEDNRAAFDNEYAIGVFRFLQSLYNNQYFPRDNLSAASDPFVEQQIVTKWTGPWEIAHLNGLPNKNFDYAYSEPPVPDDHKGPIYTYADPKNIVIFNNCRNPRMAWNFIETIIDKSGDLQLLQITGQLPRRKNLETDPFFSTFFNQNPMLIPFAKQLLYVKGDDNCEQIVEVLDIISQQYEACVVYGKKTPEQAVHDAAYEVNVLLGNHSGSS